MIVAIAASDLARTFVLLEGAIAFGFALAEVRLYWTRKRDPEDPWFGRRRLDWMACVRLGAAVLILGMVTVVSTKLGDGHLTYRTPIAIVGFTLALAGMVGILLDDESIRDEARGVERSARQRRGINLRRRDTDNIA